MSKPRNTAPNRNRSRSRSPSRKRSRSRSRKKVAPSKSKSQKKSQHERVAVITGATGFLGANLVKVLTDDEDEYFTRIVCFGLPNSNTKYINHPNVDFVGGDITNSEDIDSLLSDRGGRLDRGARVDTVFHVCGDTSFWNKLYPRQRRINVDGTRLVVEACLKHGVRKLVHTSTVDVLGHDPNSGDKGCDEEWPAFSFRHFGYNYGTTKREGEAIALSARDRGLDVVALRPGMMMGAFDFTPAFGRTFFDIKRGDVPGVPSGGASWAHVEEVAKAHLRAAKESTKHNVYNLGGHNLSYKHVFGVVAKRVEAKPPNLVLPCFLLWIYGFFAELISNWVSGKPPDMNPGMARYMSVNGYYDSSRARAELGYKIPSLQVQIDDTYNWYQSEGFFECLERTGKAPWD